MRSRALLGTIVLLAACGGRQSATLTATPAAGPADAIECTRTTLGKLKFQQVAFDVEGHRVVARKIDDKTSRPDPQFRRIIDRIEVQAAPAASGKTDLTVVAHTVAEYETHRGPTEVEENASAEATGAAQAVIQACGQP